MSGAVALGDTVQLKSGGPLMTIIQIVEREQTGPMAQCMWFSMAGQTMDKWIPISGLTKKDPQD